MDCLSKVALNMERADKLLDSHVNNAKCLIEAGSCLCVAAISFVKHFLTDKDILYKDTMSLPELMEFAGDVPGYKTLHAYAKTLDTWKYWAVNNKVGSISFTRFFKIRLALESLFEPYIH